MVIDAFLQHRSTSLLLALSTQMCTTSLLPQTSSFVSYSIRRLGEYLVYFFFLPGISIYLRADIDCGEEY